MAIHIKVVGLCTKIGMEHFGDAVSAMPVRRRRFDDGRFGDRPFGDEL